MGDIHAAGKSVQAVGTLLKHSIRVNTETSFVFFAFIMWIFNKLPGRCDGNCSSCKMAKLDPSVVKGRKCAA